ncbi:MAG: LysR family transcriptional regulator, partial [Nannocystaceae bacterium]|nr:LysR family transcriptional regulator [Nannocystaceae bacterium]
EAAARFSLIAAGQSREIDGLVRVTASQAVSAYLLPPVLESIRDEHPGIEIELVVSNAARDLRRREADIAVRHFRPQGDDLVARLLKETSEAHLYGTPEYLKRIGRPKTPEALAKRGLVLGFDDSDALATALHAAGYPFASGSSPIRTEDHLVQWELAKRDMGLCVMMQEVGDNERSMRRALPDAPPIIRIPIWLVSHRELRTNRRIGVVFDALAQALAAG